MFYTNIYKLTLNPFLMDENYRAGLLKGLRMYNQTNRQSLETSLENGEVKSIKGNISYASGVISGLAAPILVLAGASIAAGTVISYVADKL